jgi:cytochrome b
MKTYIWTWSTRLFHWLLAIGFVTAYILGGEEESLNIHAGLGIMIGTLVLFRILQGLSGPRYARFSDFPVSPASLKFFVTNMNQSKADHPGHNPLASVVMLGIIFTALLSAVSGMVIVASGEQGLFGFQFNPGSNAELFEGIHEVIVNVFLAFVVVHLTGILADTLFHPGNGTVFSMFTGYKKLSAEEARLSTSQKIFSFFWIVIPLMLFFYMVSSNPITAGENSKTEQVNETDNDED